VDSNKPADQLKIALRRGRVRTPTVIQMENVECGAAALAIMLAHYGRIVPLAELRTVCGVSRDGSKASSVVRAAKLYGLQAKGFKKEIEDLHGLAYPYIAFWNFNHFLVVEGYRHGRVYLNDPATGPRTVSVDEFDEAYTGVVLAMEPGPEFRKGGAKQGILRSVGRRLRGSFKGVALCSLTALFLVLPGVAAPALMQAFIDNIVMRGTTDWVRPIVLGMLGVALLKTILSQLQSRILRSIRLKLSVVMTSKFVWHLLHLPASYYGQRYSGEISSRIMLNDKVAGVLSGRLATTGMDAIMMMLYGYIMFRYDPALTLVAVLFAASNFGLLQIVSRRRVDTNRRLTMDLGKLRGVSISGLRNIRMLKASALESDFFARWAGFYAKATNAQQQFAGTDQMLGLAPKFLSALMAMLILVVGGLRVIDGTLSIGMLIAFQSLALSFLTPVNNLMHLGGELQELEGDINRLDDVLQNPVDPMAGAKSLQLESDTPVRLEGYVELRNVLFGYVPTSPPLISGLSLSLKPGQRVGLVGASGSGKSTVARLICGTYLPVEGEILFDGRPRDSIPRRVLVNSLAAVDQDVMLFGGTVRDNLTLWDSTISEDQLARACRDALVEDAVANLSLGYDSPLLEGAANLSGGQRQRLELARALACNPSILVLDEATSALDAETERLIDQNIRQRGCSCIIVAHRLSTIRDCDEIIVLDAGKVVQRGTHQEMLAQGGAYSRLLFSEAEALAENSLAGD
jgi:ATP-binding cassette subfamily C protein